MKYNKIFTLKNGKELLLRNGTAEDGAAELAEPSPMPVLSAPLVQVMNSWSLLQLQKTKKPSTSIGQ